MGSVSRRRPSASSVSKSRPSVTSPTDSGTRFQVAPWLIG